MATSAEYTLLNEINRSVGTLTERVEGLHGDVAESRQESKENRERVYLRLEQAERRVEETNEIMAERVTSLEKIAADVVVRLAKIEPITDAFTQMKQRGIGAMAVIGLAATLIGGTVALKWEALKDWVAGAWG